MADLNPDASPADAARWVVANVPFTVAAELLVGGMLLDLPSGQELAGSAMALWVAYDAAQVEQFEEWLIAHRMTAWTTP